jgi:hypothetical protein
VRDKGYRATLLIYEAILTVGQFELKTALNASPTVFKREPLQLAQLFVPLDLKPLILQPPYSAPILWLNIAPHRRV